MSGLKLKPTDDPISAFDFGAKSVGFVISNIVIFFFIYLIIQTNFFDIFHLTINGVLRSLSTYLHSRSSFLGKVSDQFLPGLASGFISFLKFCLQLLYTSIVVTKFLSFNGGSIRDADKKGFECIRNNM